MPTKPENLLSTVQSESRRISKPKWIRIKTQTGKPYNLTQKIVHSHGLHTICEEALCPNKGECWQHGTATFLLMGDICTRGCSFCSVTSGKPSAPDSSEPERIAQASEKMKLKHIVLTSVNRDDIEDGGASHFSRTVSAIKKRLPETTIEVLIPDFQGNWDALRTVMESDITILNHNLETVSRLYRKIRPGARYSRSLELLQRAKEMRPGVSIKSGIMVGFGEQKDEVLGLMANLLESQCEILTIGQYLQPTPNHCPVIEYIDPEQFGEYKKEGLKMGFKHVESAPFVRSSYHAWKHVDTMP